MPSDSYSFLDVAVLDAVRQRFAAGDAIAIVSADLEQVIWANGPGATVFGYPDIEAIIGASARLPLVARRQIMATSGFPEIGNDRAILVRLASGMTSRAVVLLAWTVTRPVGERAIMLAAPAAQGGSRNVEEIAERAIGGFSEDGHFIALIDGAGRVEAASAGFSTLGISGETLAALVAEVADESDRIVKRLVPAGIRSYPAGLARLTDDPARHLLVVIDENHLDESAPAEQAAPEAAKGGPPAEKPAAGDAAPHGHGAGKRDHPDGYGAQHDHWYFSGESDQPGHAERIARPDRPPTEKVPPEAVPEAATGEDRLVPASQAVKPAIDRAAAPARFVWRTDAEGRFSAISPEFAQTVGEPAADIIGRRFKDVAAAFGLDPSGDIAGLLERRDTWSGRSVLWPVAGADLKIPVDLAALPVYGRDRAFEGFRGFGVARPAEATVDAEAIGLALVADGMASAGATAREPNAGQEAPEAPRHDPFKGEVPVLTIVPKPERRFADKVIRLAEHRQPASDKGLSTLERSAFREIGERLKKDSTPRDKPNAGAAERPAASETARTADADLRTPATEPGAVSGRGSAPDRISSDASVSDEPSDDSRALAEIDDAEELNDLARLDGGQSAGKQADAPGPEAATPVRPGSLLDYAARTDRTPPEAGGGSQPVAARQGGVPGDERDSPAEGKAQARAPENADSMAAADLRDAQDDDTPPRVADEPDPAQSEERQAEFEKSAGMESSVTGPLPRVPPLRAEGFLPSAFAAGKEREAPDTSILDRLPVPLLIHSGDALHYANEEFLHLTGYHAIAEIEDAGGLGALFADPYDGESASDATGRPLRLRTQDGLEFPIEALLRSVPWRGGKALMLVIRRTGEAHESPAARPAPAESAPGDAARPDISELKARIAEMRTIIDTATDGVVLIGRDGTIRSISRPAEALFGFDSDDVAGKSFASLFAIESQRAARDYLNGLSDNGVASVLNDGREVIGREAQGRFIPLFMTIGRLPNDSGFCAVVRDITQWKRAEEDLTQARAVAERASSQKTDFLARISHEIRTPLNAIIGFSELMVDEKFGPVANDRYRDYLRDINRSGNHVLDLVNDLLDISKIEAGQQEMDYEAVSLNDTLAETVAMMQPQANRERVIIRSSFASKLPEVVADLRSVRQIALNILSNAIRYTQAGGQVILSTAYEPSGDVVMRVRDTGIGMSQAEIEQALKPFKQINALKRGRNDGTGLGLPLTKAMVEANRARFTINSTPGEGTLVEVAFPSTRVLAE
jgi:PAS domain S-box-containing protein